MTEQIGARIKEARTAAGMTQKQLAEAVENLSASSISKIERGVREPSNDELVAIAKATGTDLESLLGTVQDDAPVAPEEAAEPAAEDEAGSAPDVMGMLGSLAGGAKDGGIPVDAVMGLVGGLAGGAKDGGIPVDAVMGLVGGLAGGAKDGGIPVDAVMGLVGGLAGGAKEEEKKEEKEEDKNDGIPMDAVMGLIAGLASK